MDILHIFSIWNSISALGVISVVAVSLFLFINTHKKFLNLPTKQITAVLIYVTGIGVILIPIGYQYLFALPPCLLCWYQRILMWPAVLLSGLSLFQNELYLLRKYLYILLGIGGFIALYHIIIQTNTRLALGECATGSVSCTAIDLQVFGFLTIPMMSFFAFISLITLIWCHTRIIHNK